MWKNCLKICKKKKKNEKKPVSWGSVKIENCRERDSEKEWIEKQESIINIWLIVDNRSDQIKSFQQSPWNEQNIEARCTNILDTWLCSSNNKYF